MDVRVPRLLRRHALAAGLLAAAALSACDFTPTLDIETPEYTPGLVLRSVLAADSVATVRIGRSWNPYEGRLTPGYYVAEEESVVAVVTLLRDGQPVEILTPRARPQDLCYRYDLPPDPETGFPPTYPCGPYAGQVPLEGGATYTIRAEAEGLPVAEATVTVPRRPAVAVTEEPAAAGRRQFRIRLTDPAGQGDLYALSLLRTFTYSGDIVCDDTGCYGGAGPTTRYTTEFDTSDPVVLAAARDLVADGISFAAVTDETFDGRTWALTITTDTREAYYDQYASEGLTVQLAALTQTVYDAYQIEAFSLGDENPFAEPVNLPSNVEGGYGLVGAVALAEFAFPAEE